MKIDDGGPAFPIEKYHGAMHPHNGKLLCGGMTLRDWFAGQALVGLAGGEEYSPVCHMAADAYALADEMLTQRKQND